MILISQNSFFGGGESILQNIAKHNAKTTAIDVFIPENGPLSKNLDGIENIRIHILQFKIPAARNRNLLSIRDWLSLIRLWRKISSIHTSGRPIIFNSFLFYAANIIAKYAAFATRTSPTYIIHGWWEGTGGIGGMLSRLDSSSKFIAVSDTVKYTSIMDKERISTIRFGVPSEFFSHKPKTHQGRLLTIGNIARISTEKNTLLFVEALEILDARRISINAVITGECQDDEYLSTIERRCKSLNHINVTLDPNHTSPLDFYKLVDVVVVPSKFESLGMVSQEAMAQGLPVISTNIGAPAEIISNMETGFLFHSEDANDLANKIENITTNPALYDKVASSAHSYAQQNLRIEDSMKELLAVTKCEKQ